jgi:hypothetical protein
MHLESLNACFQNIWMIEDGIRTRSSLIPRFMKTTVDLQNFISTCSVVDFDLKASRFNEQSIEHA